MVVAVKRGSFFDVRPCKLVCEYQTVHRCVLSEPYLSTREQFI
jgi:hypothetical protein